MALGKTMQGRRACQDLIREMARLRRFAVWFMGQEAPRPDLHGVGDLSTLTLMPGNRVTRGSFVNADQVRPWPSTAGSFWKNKSAA